MHCCRSRMNSLFGSHPVAPSALVALPALGVSFALATSLVLEMQLGPNGQYHRTARPKWEPKKSQPRYDDLRTIVHRCGRRFLTQNAAIRRVPSENGLCASNGPAFVDHGPVNCLTPLPRMNLSSGERLVLPRLELLLGLHVCKCLGPTLRCDSDRSFIEYLVKVWGTESFWRA